MTRRILNIFLFILEYGIFLLSKSFRNLSSKCTCNSLRCESDFGNINYKYSSMGKDSPSCCLGHIYELFKWLDSLLNKHNLEYMIVFGSLLGAIRHKGFIPWDTDGDIAFNIKDKDKLIEIMKEEILKTHYQFICDDDICLRLNFSKTNSLHIDFYFYSLDKELFQLYGFEKTYKSDVDKIFPLKKYSFYDLSLPGPNSFEMFQKQCYGDDVFEKVNMQWTLFRKSRKKVDFKPGNISN